MNPSREDRHGGTRGSNGRTEGKVLSDQALTIRSPRDVIELVNSGIGRGSSVWILLITLGGIFTDAYDLTSFGIGVPQLRGQMHLSPAAIGTVSAAISLGAVVGALIGGYYVDKIGRLRIFLLALV